MNKSLVEARDYARALVAALETLDDSATVFVVPPFTALNDVCEVARDTALMVGAQNMHWAKTGPYTGEISPLMIKDCGADLVELGHFERREGFGETDESVNRKVLAALRHDLKPLICVGDTSVQRDYGVADEAVTSQVKIALHGVATTEVSRVLIAYEPAWAIGTSGTHASPDHVNAMHLRIREAIGSRHGTEVADEVPVLYGGSVANKNAAAFGEQAEIDGLFIGRAASNVASFVEIIRTFCAARRLDPTLA